MSLSRTLYPLLSTGLTKEDPSRHNRKIVDWDVKNQHEQQQPTKYTSCGPHGFRRFFKYFPIINYGKLETRTAIKLHVAKNLYVVFHSTGLCFT